MVMTERLNIKELIRRENTANFAKIVLEFANEISQELVDNTRVAINVGEGVPEAYFSYLKDKDTLFSYHPITGDLFIRLGGLDIANGMRNPNVTRWTTAAATPKSEAAILAARILLSDMVALTELPSGITSPLSLLEYSQKYNYPKLQEILMGIGIEGDSENKIEPLVDWEMKKRTLVAGPDEGWALVTYNFGKRLGSVQFIDQSSFEVMRCGVGHRIIKLDEKTHVTDINIWGLHGARKYDNWEFNRVWGLDANTPYRQSDHYDVGLSDDGVVAIDLPLETIRKIRDFEQPDFPWEFPDLSYDRDQ